VLSEQPFPPAIGIALSKQRSSENHELYLLVADCVIAHIEPAAKEAVGYDGTAEKSKGPQHKNHSSDS
jgi:hypothetical protein